MLEIFFIVCLEIALLAAVLLYIYNSRRKGLLNDSPAKRNVKRKEQELQEMHTTKQESSSCDDENEDGSLQ